MPLTPVTDAMQTVSKVKTSALAMISPARCAVFKSLISLDKGMATSDPAEEIESNAALGRVLRLGESKDDRVAKMPDLLVETHVQRRSAELIEEREHLTVEQALLRDVPRTATVAASVNSKLYALNRDDFLAGVTGHSVAHALAREVSDMRLRQSDPARDD
jgi:CRP-like cAMP-binding protein